MVDLIVGLLGLATLILGVWLFRNGKGVEKKMSSDYTTKTAFAFTNNKPFGTLGLWGQHSTRPLAYLCTATGIVCLAIFAVSVLNIPLPL